MRSRNRAGLSRKGKGQLAIGILGLLLSVGYLQQTATTLPVGSLSAPGAAIYPFVVGGLMVLVSLGVVLERLVLPPDPRERPLALPRGADRRRLLGVVGTVVAYAVLVNLLGFLWTTVLSSLALVHLIKPGSWRRTVITALAISLSTYVLFVTILDVPLPRGYFW